MGAERRVHPRAELTSRATVFAGDRKLSAPIVDISESGLSMRCPTPTVVGTFLRVNFRVNEESDRWLDVDGVVRHMSPGRGGEYRYGVQFVAPSPSCVDAVRRYVRRRLAATRARGPSALRTNPKGDVAPVAEAPPERPAPRRRPERSGPRAAAPERPRTPANGDPELRRLFQKALDKLDD